MKQTQFQIVEGLQLTKRTCTEEQLFRSLKSDKLRNRIEPIRKYFAEGKIEEANQLKKKLPALLVSGIFKESRRAENLVGYNQIVCLDLDKQPTDHILNIKEKAINCPYTNFAFLSPSGTGIKLLIKVSSDAESHKIAYKQVLNYYTQLLGVAFDEQTNDITRLMYASYDPDAYYYPDSQIFMVIETSISVSKPTLKLLPAADEEAKYRKAHQYTCNKVVYKEGFRNKFLFLLANNCNRLGIPMDVLYTFIDWCDLPEAEIQQTVNSAYKKTEEFNKWQSNTKVETPSKSLHYEDVMANTPIIPHYVKERLPEVMRQLICGYNDRQSDMGLTAVLSLLSGVTTTTKGVYNGAVLTSSINNIVTAPSGSGKSVTGHMRDLFLPLHRKLIQESKCPNGLFLPDNTNTTALIHKLYENGGKGILFSTDMGFLGHALRKDTAGLQAILRVSQSAEVITLGRTVKKTTEMVDSPQLIASLCATPPEFRQLFTSNEDGLLSRFIHYGFLPDKEWQDIWLESLADHQRKVSLASNTIIDIYMYVNSMAFEFTLQEQQLLALNTWMEDEKRLAVKDPTISAITPIINRMGQVVFKLSMVIANIRAWEQKSDSLLLFISDEDFDVVMQICKVFYQHTALIVNYVTKDTNTGMDAQVTAFLNSLPNEFTRKEAIYSAKEKSIKVSDRTIDNWLKLLTELKLVTHAYNRYCKTLKESENNQAA